jgi:3-hydroxy-3-methylglutaryl CoA synthase
MMQNVLVIASVSADLATIAAPSPAQAASAEEQRLCQDDAFRVCSHTIPDEARTKACMVANLRRLSPGCRRIMTQSRRRR